jgi:hypothetical protein
MISGIGWVTWPRLRLRAFGGALVIGLSYGWVAWCTGSIRWTVVSHICLNFLVSGIWYRIAY